MCGAVISHFANSASSMTVHVLANESAPHNHLIWMVLGMTRAVKLEATRHKGLPQQRTYDVFEQTWVSRWRPWDQDKSHTLWHFWWWYGSQRLVCPRPWEREIGSSGWRCPGALFMHKWWNKRNICQQPNTSTESHMCRGFAEGIDDATSHLITRFVTSKHHESARRRSVCGSRTQCIRCFNEDTHCVHGNRGGTTRAALLSPGEICVKCVVPYKERGGRARRRTAWQSDLPWWNPRGHVERHVGWRSLLVEAALAMSGSG